MPDISMCNPKHCTIKKKCYRFTATPSEFWQSWFTEEPYNQQTKTCDFYWEVETKKKNK
ncbi:MAG: hypothetical protein ACYC5G_05225 [Candidatus Doudnabacteria bacterium]